ncbi:MAG: YgcG family protein, partial [Xanthobacteraceae bacterium]
MKTVAAALLAWMLCWAVVAVADVAIPPLTGRVVDQTGTLTSEQIATLDGTLQAFEQRKGSQIAVLIVPTTEPETIEQFSIRVAEAWKIGRKKIDDGAILVVAKDDRRLRIEVGYGLEGALTDVTSKRIIDEIITPKFRQGDFAGGISAGVDRIIGVIDGEPLPEPKRQQQGANIFDSLESVGPVAFFAVLVFGGIFRAMFGRLLGAAVTGGLVGLVIWFLAGALAVAAIIGAIAFVFTLVGDSVVS